MKSKRKPKHIIDFMQSQGYQYDPITNRFVKPNDTLNNNIFKEMFGGFNNVKK